MESSTFSASTLEKIISQPSAKQDAISALISLGYKDQQAERAVKTIYQEELGREGLIRDALKELAGK